VPKRVADDFQLSIPGKIRSMRGCIFKDPPKRKADKKDIAKLSEWL
jgi:hypothetical protein